MKKINFFLMLLFLTQNKSMEEEEINTFNKFSKNVADLIREKLLKRGKKTNINLYEIGTKYKDREEVKNNLRKLEDQYSMILNQNKRLINEKDILKQNEKKINIESINNATKLLINGGLIFVLIGLIIKINQILKNELLKKNYQFF